MNRQKAVADALAQHPRREIVEVLVGAGPDGLAAGVIASGVDAMQTELQGHLNALLDAGLLECEIRGRRVRYRADFARVALIAPEALACLGATHSAPARLGEGAPSSA